jgi:hypothetical protein
MQAAVDSQEQAIAQRRKLLLIAAAKQHVAMPHSNEHTAGSQQQVRERLGVAGENSMHIPWLNSERPCYIYVDVDIRRRAVEY